MLLTACTTKLVYFFADDLAANFVEDIVTFNDEQEAVIEAKLAQGLYWHQQTQLPEYKKHLQDLLNIDLAHITDEQLEAHRERFVSHYIAIRTHFLPDIIEILTGLSDPQCAEMSAYVKEKQKEYREKFKGDTAEEIQEYYQERIEERLEDWLGDLKPMQQTIVQEWAQQLVHVRSTALTRQEIMNQYWREALSNRQQPEFANKVRAWIVDPRQFYSEKFSKDLEFNRLLAQQSLIKILRLVDEEQRQHFKEEILDWLYIISTLQELDLKPE